LYHTHDKLGFCTVIYGACDLVSQASPLHTDWAGL